MSSCCCTPSVFFHFCTLSNIANLQKSSCGRKRIRELDEAAEETKSKRLKSLNSGDVEAEQICSLQFPCIGTLFPFDDDIFAPTSSHSQVKYKLSDLVKFADPLKVCQVSHSIGKGCVIYIFYDVLLINTIYSPCIHFSGFGEVFLADYQYSKEKVAIKTQEIRADNEDNLALEVHMMYSIDHPNVVKLMDTFVQGGNLWVCFDSLLFLFFVFSLLLCFFVFLF